ncbi:bifunctional glycosyltransferase family 2 protein/CDP-glycerol:glycerophosphate glycerophosphotransferase [Lentilactobacillus senioris]|uniref:bifunctional glycosyltransferase family 2 protein/CDP-glycerol:glycerophosphate glycerophosphotransferase n=1 Tax=Lentilactobacillus senioris TaxID=931534 RepID=UPI00227F66B6|nr:bifunctional glycosyltransferase family 2 protein/CDP-glycerol:glycerophosphate glycerophosphotransferase [Lentilactobacillus senioris]MCY9806251.1 bifunctional glycosyltransferase family 2 protein/CDP-glycerol:glycerophosphate glycerophosphotransferase [Lentilactobacillus senioris]
MKYSIITPVKTADISKLPLLKANLDKQGTNDIEWLLVGNQELVNTQFDWHSDYPIRFINSTKDTVGGSRNVGLDNATGDYLVFVDADDFLVPDTLAKYLPVVEQVQLLNLHQYPTYEPVSSFLTSITSNEANDNLPDWGGRGRKNHINWHQLNLLNDNQITVEDSKIAASKNYQQWLTNKYTIFNQDNWDYAIHNFLPVAGNVVSRKLVVDTNSRFDEDNQQYGDYRFTLSILDHCQTIAQLVRRTYIKERHNDPINDPSVTQASFAENWQNWLTALTSETPKLTSPKLKIAVNGYALRRIHRFFYKGVVSETTAEEQSEILANLTTYLQTVPESATRNLGRTSRNILKKVRTGNNSSAYRQIKRVVSLRYLKRAVLKHGRGLPRAMYQTIFTKLPVKKNLVIYESFLGRNYSDSPKYIYEYLRKNFPGQYKHVWIVAKGADVNIPKHKDTITVRRFSFRYMYYMAVSNYQVINMRQPQWFQKRPGTKFLSTWHGTPLKHLVFDMDNVASANPMYKQIFYKQSRQWDYLVTANQFSVDVFKHAFMYPEYKMIKSGYPRNDILNAPDKDERQAQIKAKLHIPADKKVILYAPTWRDDEYYGVGQYKFDLKLDILRLKRELGDNYVLVLRTHYFIADHLDTSGFGDFVFNESSYDDIAELYLISDMLITDYSSVFFDYAVLKRPILYFVYDYEKYASVLRGFYLNMDKDLPGPLLKTNDEVIEAIKNIDNVTAEYHDRYQAFSNRFNNWEDGHATERVVNTVFLDQPMPKR